MSSELGKVVDGGFLGGIAQQDIGLDVIAAGRGVAVVVGHDGQQYNKRLMLRQGVWEHKKRCDDGVLLTPRETWQRDFLA